jgi:uncharacterized protein
MSQKLTVHISGMHCKSCEILVEENFKEISGVTNVNADFKKGIAHVEYDGERPSHEHIEKAVHASGYTVGKSTKNYFFSRNTLDYQELVIVSGLLFILFVVLSMAGVFSKGFSFDQSPTLGVVFLIGLAAGVSTCMALVGGLVLGISARHAELHPEATRIQNFRPHLYFNLGRIISYALLGGLIGIVGRAMAPTDAVLGFFVLIAGFLMLYIGLKLTSVMPGLERFGIYMPKSISKLLGAGDEVKEYNHRGAMISGALTFFLPCGFTQAMQLYAVSTGNFTQGALIMTAFALGTMPGLLGIGGISSIVKGYWSRIFFKAVAIIVIVLGLVNIKSGYNLTGITFAKRTPETPQAEIVDGVQVIKMKQRGNGYFPNEFTVKKGIPVRWEVMSTAQYSCASYLVSRGLNIGGMLKPGNNVIEFTPTEVGPVRFSCSMGMYGGIINVIE